MHRHLLLLLSLLVPLALMGCPTTTDDDDTSDDDDASGADDDDTGPDDDDSGPDDDDTGPDDDDTGPDDDDATGDDDDHTGDDDDSTGDDDDATGDDDDSAPDDDDSAPDDDDSVPDDDDATGDDDDSAAACIQDGFEPNDVQGDAAPVTPNTIPDLTACPTDDDWFAVSLTAGAVLDITATFTHTEGNIDLELYNETGALLDDSLSTADGEDVTYTAVADEIAYLRVILAADLGGQTGNPYELEIIATGLGCAGDSFEPNDALGQAQSLSAGQTPTLTACGDDDWYSISLAAGETLELEAMFQHAEGNLDMHLVDTGANVIDTADSLTDNEALTYTATNPETIYIQVVLTNDTGGTPGNLYLLDLDVGLAACTPDGLEPNDDAGSASALAIGTESALTACPGDDDWFAFSLAAGQTADLGAVFANAEGNINLTLRDVGGGVLDSAATTGDFEALSYTAPVDEDLLLQVELFSDAGAVPGNTYDLTLAVSAPTCATDALEPNDSQGAAAIVTATTYSALSICDTDDDYYDIALTNGESVDFDIAFSAAEGNIDLELLDAAGNVVDSSTGTGESEAISYTAGADETVTLRVFLATDSGALPGNTYEMTVGGVPPSCLPDAFEPNDADTSPAAITDGTHNNLTICPSDADWYSITLGVGDTLTVDLLFDHDEGDLGLEAFDALGNSLVSANTTTDDEQLVLVGTGAEVLLQVTLDPDQGNVPGNSYTLDLDLVTLSCPTDLHEPNDSSSSPSAITTGTITGLSACDTDEDWYSIELLAGDILTVDVLFSDADGDIDLAVTDIGGGVIDNSSTPGDNESVTTTISADGTYLIQVVMAADAGDPGNDYTLLVSTGSSVCEPDDSEPNNELIDATPITPGIYNDLTSCDGDEDWYSIPLPATAVLDIAVDFQHAEGDIDVFLLDSSQNIVDQGVSINDNETISLVVPASDTYIIQVVLTADSGALPGNSYSLSVSAPPVPCPTDAAEPNDNLLDSTQLEAGVLTDLAACPTDSDWYLLSAAAADVFTVDAIFSHAEGDIDLYLYDASEVLVDQGVTLDDNEQVGAAASGNDNFLLEVVLASDAGPLDGNLYSLEVIGLSEVCLGDLLESDNDFTAANVVADADEVTGLTACATDSDWFAIDLLNGDAFVAEATFLNAEGDIDLSFYDPSLGYLNAATSTDDDELLEHDINQDGTHYVEVALASDAGVSPGNTYDISFDVVSTVCVPDVQEPNDNLQDASVLTAGTYTDLTACSDPDWYAIDLATDESLDVTALFSHDEGDIDVALYDDGASLIQEATSGDDNESMNYLGGPAATVYVEVTLTTDLGNDAGNTYDLELVTTEVNCTDDASEPNDDQGSPLSLSNGQTAGLVSCPGNPDWWNFSASAGDIIDVLAQFDGADGDIDLELYDPSGTVVVAANSVSSNEQLFFTAVDPGQYTLLVAFISEGDAPDGVAYDLNLSVASESCLFDWGEDNDEAGGAAVLNVGNHPHLVVCETDDDWFSFDLPEGQVLDLDATFAHAEGDVDLYLYDGTLTAVGQAVSTTDNEAIDYEPPPSTGGTHFLEVVLAADSGSVTGNPYSLNLVFADTSGCPADEFEDNDTMVAAQTLSLGSYPGQSVCETDADWLALGVGAGDTITIDLTFLHADGDIDLTVYDQTLTQVGESISVDDNEQVVYTAPSAGGVLLEITMPADDAAGGGNTYDLNLSGNASSCTPDAFEDDDALIEAYPLPLGTTTGFGSCPSDDDWSLVLLDVGETATWTAGFIHAEGDIDLEVLDLGGNVLDSAVSTSDDETLIWTATYFGYHYVRTYLATDSGDPGNGYTLDLSIN